MKRILFGCIAALALAGAASAQTTATPPGTQPKNQPAQTITVSGKLEVVNGFIGMKADGVSYILPRLRMLVGFVPAIQEGAAVKVEGYAYPIPARDAPRDAPRDAQKDAPQSGYAILAITKLSIGGKDYDFTPFEGRGPFGGRGGMMGRGMRGGPWGEGRW